MEQFTTEDGGLLMTKEQALEKKLEQVRWQFPNHIVFKRNEKIFHFDPNNFDRKKIFSQTGLKVSGEKYANVALYDPEYFAIDSIHLVYKGLVTKRIPQPINLKRYDWLFNRCRCETVDLSDWDFSEVISMCFMFNGSGVKAIILGDADFSKCENLSGWFYCCDNLQELILGNYRVAEGVDVMYMFWCCSKLCKKYVKGSKKELANIFKSGQWNTLHERMEIF